MGYVPKPDIPEVVEWLASLEMFGNPYEDVAPCAWNIRGTIHEGATYTIPAHAPAEGTPAFRDGRGDHPAQRCAYFVGALPRVYARSSRVKFTRSDDGTVWYVAGWFPPSTDAELVNEYHPFGPMWLAREWPVTDRAGRPSAIDQYEDTPYRDIPVTVWNPDTVKYGAPIESRRDGLWLLTHDVSHRGDWGSTGHLRTFSRYGRNGEDCAPVAWRLAYLYAREAGEDVSYESLDQMMSLVVNESDSVAHIVRSYGRRQYR